MDNKSSIKGHLGGVYNINYHLVWTPKRRKSVLIGLIEDELKQILINSWE